MSHLAILLFALLLAVAQDAAKPPAQDGSSAPPQPAAQQPTERTPSPAPAQTPTRPESPFAADEDLRKLLDARPPGDDSEPLGDRPALPEMRLRGLVKMKGKEKPAALIELRGIGTYTAREGEKLSFSLPGRTISARPDPSAAPGSQGRLPGRDGGTPTGGETSVVSSASHGVVVREQIPIALRIEHVGPDGVLVEVGTLGQYLVIR
jgi:hypothetical protein